MFAARNIERETQPDLTIRLAKRDCVEKWNGWYHRVLTGEMLDPLAVVLKKAPRNVQWVTFRLGYVPDKKPR
jgi:hypothetical protein